MTDILIGVGGTGAKIVESVMILLAAGMGPKELHVGLVDQDNANGNVARTKTLISNYGDFRDLWSRNSEAAALDWQGGGDAGPFDFCRTEIVPLFADSPAWCPGKDQTTLNNMIGQNLHPPLKDLFDLLFMEGEEEQDLMLGEGYRGRAHVGAAALISRLIDPANPLTANMTELMAGGGSREQVRIFLAGSAFGGTGAAGFPTIARELNRIRSSKEFVNKGNVAIGGALMLPYFGFAAPEQEDKNKVVTTDELLPKAQLALEHYGNLFQTEPAIDRFYLVGWDEFFQLAYHEAGNAEQCNPPLLPELMAAAAAIGFFRDEDSATPAATVTDERVRLLARSGQSLRWSDFPLSDMQEKLGHLFRFAVYWRYAATDLIRTRRPLIGKGNWTHQLNEKAKFEDAVTALQALDTLLGDILTFAASVEWMARRHWEIGPWQIAALRNHQFSPTPTAPVQLLDPHPAPAERFSNAVRTEDGKPLARDAATVYDDLENRGAELAAGEHRGFGRVVAAAYRATKVN